jgi:hypothetical protein
LRWQPLRAGFAVLAAAPAASASAADQFGYGTYSCVTQRLVTARGHSSALRPETDKFLVIIEQIKREPGMMSCDPTRWPDELHKYNWWWNCGAINQAVISKDKTALNEFRSDDLWFFLDTHGDGGTYRLVFNIIYLEEGTCQRMK